MTNRYPQPMDQAKAAILKLLQQAPYSHQGIAGVNLKNICPQFAFLRESVRNQLIQAMGADGLIYVRKDQPPRDSYNKCTIFDAKRRPLSTVVSTIKPSHGADSASKISLPVTATGVQKIKFVEGNRIMKTTNAMQPTPEKLREQAAEMLKRAEQIEKSGATVDAIKKVLVPALRDVMQAKHASQQAIDAMIDTGAVLDKAISRFESALQEVLS